MSSFVVYPVAHEIAEQARTTRRAPDYGHPVVEEVATGTGPCRQCLRGFTVGAERRLLFTYRPFSGTAIAQPGPIFVHAEGCVPHAGAGYPDGLKSIPVLAQAIHRDGTIGGPSRLPTGNEAATLSKMLAEPNVQFVHLRHAVAGCFIARVERIAPQPALALDPCAARDFDSRD